MLHWSTDEMLPAVWVRKINSRLGIDGHDEYKLDEKHEDTI